MTSDPRTGPEDTEDDGPDQMSARLADAWKRGYEARAGNKPYTSNPWGY